MPLPTLGLLQSFCKQQITDLLPANVCRPRKGTAVSIEEADEGDSYVLRLADGQELVTKAIIYTHVPAITVLPSWAKELHTPADAATVHLVHRRALQEQEQEVDPGWFGGKFMRGFQAQQDPRQRLLAAREAHPHGTINTHTMRALKQAQAAQQIRMWEGWEEQDVVLADHVWLATGSSPDAMACPFLRNVQEQWPTRILGGYPVLQDTSMAWPGLPLLIIGRMGLLSQGPAAGLAGRTSMAGHTPSWCRLVHVRTNPNIIDVGDLPASLERSEIQKYSFVDDDFDVLVLVDLPEPVSKDQVGATDYMCPSSMVTVVPGKCKLSVKHRRLTLHLRKTSDAEWRFLKG
ncbi:hypothetical protein WJX84_006300 [Apatococcus fuscideae]|uniref:NudC domain-containing protein 1 n=1 Tax=Apatococcus fuscideae TaxID=2026836 RepID=A0AAW1SKR8_9CHLO